MSKATPICTVDNGMTISELPRAVRDKQITRDEALVLYNDWLIDKALFHGLNRSRPRLDAILNKILNEIKVQDG